MKYNKLAHTLTVLLFIITLTSCSKAIVKPNIQKHVDTLVVVSHDVPYVFDYPAIVQGVVDYPVVAQVSGAIFKQFYIEGSHVSKNAILYQIDPRPFELQLANAEGQYTKDKAALDNNKIIYDRYTKLYVTHAVSLQDVETADINYKASLGNVQTDQALIDQAKLNLEYCDVRAPADGYIAERQVTVGDMVTAYQTLLNHINSVNDMYIQFSMPENDRLELEQGILDKTMSVPSGYKFRTDLQLSDGTMIKDEGYVEFADTRISLSNGVWNLRAYVDNIDLKNKLLSGQFIHIYLNGAAFVNAYAIPQVAVFRDDVGSFVYVIDSATNKVVRRPITTGKMVGDQWLITSGLHDGDKVIVNGGLKVEPGDLVTIDSTTTQHKTPVTTESATPSASYAVNHNSKPMGTIVHNVPSKHHVAMTHSVLKQSKPLEQDMPHKG